MKIHRIETAEVVLKTETSKKQSSIATVFHQLFTELLHEGNHALGQHNLHYFLPMSEFETRTTKSFSFYVQQQVKERKWTFRWPKCLTHLQTIADHILTHRHLMSTPSKPSEISSGEQRYVKIKYWSTKQIQD